MRKSQSIKPVMVDGKLVTPVSGIPAAPRNWAPPCQVCRVRKCLDCGKLVDHRMNECDCGGKSGLSAKEECPDTFVASRQGRKQFIKCRRCGHSWSHVITIPPQ